MSLLMELYDSNIARNLPLRERIEFISRIWYEMQEV